MGKYDINDFRISRWGALEYRFPKDGWLPAGDKEITWYEKYQKSKVSTRSINKSLRKSKISQRALSISSVKGKYGKYFSSGTKFTSRQGHLASWAKPMTLRGGVNGNNNWERVWYHENGIKHRTSSNQRWGANINQSNSKTGSGITVLHGSKQWIRQIQISLYALRVQSENFRVMAGKRALKVFQNSIKYQQFYSKNGNNWPELSSFTRRMRALRGTGSHKLKEYERLYKSIQISPSNSGRIETKPVYISKQWQTGKKSKLTQTTLKRVVFAGYHNEGKGHHGPISTHYKKRQFMGHSSYLNPFTDSFMRKMMKLYLFDSVFLVKKS